MGFRNPYRILVVVLVMLIVLTETHVATPIRVETHHEADKRIQKYHTSAFAKPLIHQHSNVKRSVCSAQGLPNGNGKLYCDYHNAIIDLKKELCGSYICLLEEEGFDQTGPNLAWGDNKLHYGPGVLSLSLKQKHSAMPLYCGLHKKENPHRQYVR